MILGTNEKKQDLLKNGKRGEGEMYGSYEHKFGVHKGTRKCVHDVRILREL